TVAVTITPVNDPPVCADLNESTPQGTARAVTVDCSDIDGDTLVYAVVSAPSHGSVTVSGPDFVYTPAEAYVGPDAFTFNANDGAADSNSGSVTVRVDPVIAAAGDIADCNLLGDEITSALLDDIDGTVVTLGDNVYDQGTFSEFMNCYEPSWGRHKVRTHPAVGNHEYEDPAGGAQGYFDYMNGVGNFAGPAGDRDKGYYSFDLGEWHFVVINSSCSQIGGCDVGSLQETWLRADLAAHSAACTAAVWHHPRFSSGTEHGGTPRMESIWQALYHGGADIAMSGHEHNYERFAPQTATGVVDPAFGLREVVVGTGGKGGGYPFGPPEPNSEVRANDTLGVLKVVLRPAGFEWSFVHEPGAVFTDIGSGACHGQPDPANTVSPTVSGSPRQGRPLTVTPGTWVGSPPLTYAYQWRSCADVGADSCTDIPGATGSTYTPGPAEVGFRLRAVVTGTSAAGSTAARSNKTNLIQPP
ncbi:MAG: Ig-like domain-containing protein, partial [Actinomycetota bacterium]